MNEHVFERFDAELDKLRSRLIKMGTLVQQQIENTIKALNDDDKNIANLVIAGDEKINRIDVKIDKQCMRIFAMLQPVASDLRVTMSALSINDNLELIGDILVDIAETVLKMPEVPEAISRSKIIEFGKTVERMMTLSVDSFIYANTNLADEVLELRKLGKEQFNEALDYHIAMIKADVNMAEYCSYLNDTGRNMKFISDLAANIAHEIIFIVDARIVRHGYQLNRREIYEEDSDASIINSNNE
jgi:phosphate transport system protein